VGEGSYLHVGHPHADTRVGKHGGFEEAPVRNVGEETFVYDWVRWKREMSFHPIGTNRRASGLQGAREGARSEVTSKRVLIIFLL